MTRSSPLFALRGVHFSYEKAPLFSDLHLEIRASESVAIIGPGASGKSSLLRLAVGLLEPQSGTVHFKGTRLGAMTRTDRVQMARSLGVCLQHSGLFDSRSCGENLAFVLREHTDAKPSEISERVGAALDSVGLYGNENTRVHELSGGMRKRLGIARAFLLRPEVVLLDDPTAGLDPITSRQIVDLILEFKDTFKMSLVVITSDPPRAFELAERLILLDEGRVVTDGPAKVLKQDPSGAVFNFLRGLSGT